ncbi:Pfs domain protein [Aspergillus melleus]|uniref:Pfs domain protein n=1 Tax=Aspergillus melleus TaxID=138277 RepID=UPI001E8CA396|nr:uncharacterized protein LDX57_013049 [Aspergillus melleus]KAH8435419.1 hypothetical protein LDX57_013049 [Aspergillus melleus]
MELDDIMGLWDQHLEDTDDDVGTPQVQSGEESPSIDEDIRIADDDEDLPGLTAYRELITGSPVYEWLLGSLRRGLHLHPAEPNVQDAIRNRIIDSLPSSRRVSRYDQPRIYQVVFLLNWDPSAFITEQEHDLSKEGFLSKIITITGTSQDAQAMTCLQYLHQTWHLYGSDILQLVEATLLDERDYEHRCILSDNTQLAAWVNDKQFCVEVTGIADSIAEIGEQLAWLGSALRSSPHASGISYCTPFVSNAKVEGTSIPTSQAPPITRISCGIDFKHDDQEQSRSTSPMGQCWHHLFRNPTVVMGFPIPYRSRQGIGLEIPLNILAGLVQANQVDAFSDKLFIKGFSNLLIPTEYIRDQDQMIWHLCYNVQGDRISYLDGIGAHVGHITLADLESSRHILGWCSDARFYAGAVDANYSINRSWLEPPSSCCSLKNTFIAAGRLITGGDPAIYGNRDIPYRLIRDEYIEKLSWIARQYVVMWDAGEKRGWLVNGASALLHLLLASLHFNRTDPLGFAFRLNLTDIRVPEKTSTPSSAMEILLDPDNLSLKLYHAKQSEPNETTLPPAQLRDRVDRLYNLLEKIMDHQVNIMGTDNRVSRNMARGNLEGWDFKDLSTQEDPLYPRFCKLGTRGKSWVDLTRSIRAATLFGTGFDNGAPACKCVGCPEQTDHSELAQVILPSQFKKRIPKHNTVRSSSWRHGGVVFGYNKDLRWCWKDTGSPKQEDALPSSDDSGSDSDGDFYDSGLGTSFAPSATVDGSGRLPSSMSTLEGSSHEDYEVGIVCALPKELLAVRAMFDSIYSELENDQNDPNCYCLGRIKAFNVVAAGLPDGDYGMNSATNVASHLTRTFRRVKFCLVVGIGGGVPSAAQDIRLGDVVVGTSVIQVDMGKWIQDSEFRMTADTQRPPHFLRSVITKIKAVYSKSFDSAVNPLLGDLKQISTHEPQYQYPGADRDTLFDSDYVHVEDEPTCDKCIGSRRPRIRQHDGPNIFYGRIASGNQVVRDAKYRERLGREGVSCVEMEGAGVMRTTDCLVIRGICDYADSHKNKQWQEYAAATAAAYAKFFLSCMRYSDDEFAIRVPSQLEASMGPIPLQKQKRAAPCTDFGQPLVLKRTRRN